MRLEWYWPWLCTKLLFLTFILPLLSVSTPFLVRPCPGTNQQDLLTSCILIMTPGSWHSLQKKLPWMSHNIIPATVNIKSNDITWLKLRLNRFIKCSLSLYVLQLRCHNISKCERVSARQLLVPVLDSPWYHWWWLAWILSRFADTITSPAPDYPAPSLLLLYTSTPTVIKHAICGNKIWNMKVISNINEHLSSVHISSIIQYSHFILCWTSEILFH